MKMFLVILVSFLLFSCRLVEVGSPADLEIKKDKMNDVMSTMIYVKDPKTNLCFALHEESPTRVSLTCVPCDSLKNVSVLTINAKK